MDLVVSCRKKADRHFGYKETVVKARLCNMLPMAIDILDCMLIREAYFSRRYSDNLSILSVEIHNIIVPGSAKVSDDSPKASGFGEERTRNLSQRMKEKIVYDLKKY